MAAFMMPLRLLLPIVAFAMFLCGRAQAQSVALPELKGAVADAVGALPADRRARLDAELREFARTRGPQLFVVIVERTEPESIEDFAQRAFTTWKPGRAGVDDGVLFVLAVGNATRKMRIHTGYGLEDVVPDVVAKRILADTVRPVLEEKGPGAAAEVAAAALLERMRLASVPLPGAGDARTAETRPRERVLAGSAIFLVLVVLATLLLTGRKRLVTVRVAGVLLSVLAAAFFVLQAGATAFAALAVLWPVLFALFLRQYAAQAAARPARLAPARSALRQGLNAARKLKGDERIRAELKSIAAYQALERYAPAGAVLQLPRVAALGAFAMVVWQMDASPWSWPIAAGWALAAWFLGRLLGGALYSGPPGVRYTETNWDPDLGGYPADGLVFGGVGGPAGPARGGGSSSGGSSDSGGAGDSGGGGGDSGGGGGGGDSGGGGASE